MERWVSCLRPSEEELSLRQTVPRPGMGPIFMPMLWRDSALNLAYYSNYLVFSIAPVLAKQISALAHQYPIADTLLAREAAGIVQKIIANVLSYAFRFIQWKSKDYGTVILSFY